MAPCDAHPVRVTSLYILRYFLHVVQQAIHARHATRPPKHEFGLYRTWQGRHWNCTSSMSCRLQAEVASAWVVKEQYDRTCTEPLHRQNCVTRGVTGGLTRMEVEDTNLRWESFVQCSVRNIFHPQWVHLLADHSSPQPLPTSSSSSTYLGRYAPHIPGSVSVDQV